MKIDNIINEISKLENITTDIFKSFIKMFEKFIRTESRKYYDNSGLEDYKMNKKDYTILLSLYTSTSDSPNKLLILLLYMYSY